MIVTLFFFVGFLIISLFDIRVGTYHGCAISTCVGKGLSPHSVRLLCALMCTMLGCTKVSPMVYYLSCGSD